MPDSSPGDESVPAGDDPVPAGELDVPTLRTMGQRAAASPLDPHHLEVLFTALDWIAERVERLHG